MNKSKLRAFMFIMISFSLVFSLFQNCASDVQFQDLQLQSVLGTVSGDDVICDPLSAVANCDITSKLGLVGYLYYLTQDQSDLFAGSSNGLFNAVLADYINYGTRVNKVILMSEVNIQPQSWETGFIQSDGRLVKDSKGNDLFEWFSLDMYGYLSLPAGDYQFAMVSDDGMLVELNNQLILNDDGIHAPRWRCSSTIENFKNDERKEIHIQYFQGPRTQVAMQLYYRPAASSSEACGANGGWTLVPPQSYTHF